MAQVPLTRELKSHNGRYVEAIVRENGNCPAWDQLEEMEKVRIGPKTKPNSTAKAQFLMLFAEMAENWGLSKKRFGPEGDGLWAFKAEIGKVQYRFPCFQDGNKWIVTHGFEKPGAKKGLGPWPPRELNRAKELRGEYITRKSRQTNLRVIR